MTQNPRNILLTGATGFLGHYLLAEILRRSHAHCRILVAAPGDRQRLAALLANLDIDLDERLADGRITFAVGRLPDRLGEDAFGGIDCVIHAAASMLFRRNVVGEPYRTNVDGTKALVDHAARAGVRHFVYISTAYVGGRRHGTMPAAVLDTVEDVANDYERSKWHAEAAVAAWLAPDRRVTICRPSILIGDRQTGRATNFGGIYLLARAVSLLARAVEENATIDRFAVPLRIMGRPDAALNVIPVCTAARQTIDVAFGEGPELSIHNIVNPRPPTAADVKTWLESYFQLAGGAFTDRAWPWPGPSRFEEAFYSAGEPVRDYFLRDLCFEALTSGAVAATNCVVDERHFHQCLGYAESVAWGRYDTPEREPRKKPLLLDPAWYFEDYLVRCLPHSTVTRVAALTARVGFVIDGLVGSNWVCGFEGGRLAELRRGENGRAADFGFRVERRAFEEIVSGRRSLQSAFFAGAADLFGDTLGALKMVPLIETFLREFPVV